MKFYSFLILLLSLVSCNTEDTTELINSLDKTEKINNVKATNLFEINWLVGNWIDSTSFPGQTIIENWSLVNDSLVGKRGTIVDLDTTFGQVSKIFIRNESPIYTLEPEGSAFVSFKATDFSKSSLTFKNIANPSPTQIKYAITNNVLNLELTFLTPAGDRVFKHTFNSY